MKEISTSINKQWITEGEKSNFFLKEMLKLTQCKYGVLVPNGTQALSLCAMALNLKPGDEIIIPDFTFFGSVSSMIMIGLQPILCDVDPLNFQIDLSSAEKVLTKKTKAIMPVHIYGGSVKMDDVVKFAKKNKLYIIEDAAQGVNVSYYKKAVGSFGDTSAFSFYADKTVTTGQGGLVVTQKENIYKNLQRLTNQGRIKSGEFKHYFLGYNFKFNDILASIGLVQLKKLNNIVRRKIFILNRFKKNLSINSKVTFFKPIKGSNFIPFRIPIIVPNAQLLMKYMEKHNIQTRGFFYPMHKQNGLKKIIKKQMKKMKCCKIRCKNQTNCFFKNSNLAYNHGVALPCYPSLKNHEIDHISKIINKFYLEK